MLAGLAHAILFHRVFAGCNVGGSGRLKPVCPYCHLGQRTNEQSGPTEQPCRVSKSARVLSQNPKHFLQVANHVGLPNSKTAMFVNCFYPLIEKLPFAPVLLGILTFHFQN